MKNLSKLLALLAIITLSCHNKESNIADLKIIEKDMGIKMPLIIEPVIPDNTVNIIDFGAVGDGQTLNTNAISDAIDAVSKKGGGKVVIPRGLWLTGPIILKSNINLHADEGALVIFSSDKDLYPVIETNYEGKNQFRCTSPIYGNDLENIAITGNGIFDGTGEVWRPVKKEKMTESQWKSLIESGGVVSQDGNLWNPSPTSSDGQNSSSMNVADGNLPRNDFGRNKNFLRPVMVSLVNCKKVLLDGPVFQNSPAWCLHPLLCQDLTIRNVTVKNPWYSQNGDGLDIESCLNTIVYNSNFDVGDDAICIKSGKDAEGRKRGKPTENLVVKNCIVHHGHGGVTVGSEMSGGVKNVYVSGCTFIGTDVGLRFKSNRGRGGVVENIFFTDINMINIQTQAISFNLFYGGLSVSEMLAQGKKNESETAKAVPPVTEETPMFRNITIRNLTCRGALQSVLLQGLPELNLEGVKMENIIMESDQGFACMDVKGLTVKGMKLIQKDSLTMQFINSQNVNIEELSIPENQNSYITVNGEKSKDIIIKCINPGKNIKTIIGNEADGKTINIQ
jgi:polygalacturonase